MSVSDPKLGARAHPEDEQHRLAHAAPAGALVVDRLTTDRGASSREHMMACGGFPYGPSAAGTRAANLHGQSEPLEAVRWPRSFQLHARSVSLRTMAALDPGPADIKEIARFHRALNLKFRTSIVALVLPEIGNGPFHIVVDRLPPAQAEPTAIRRTRAGIDVGAWFITTTDRTVLWDPRPRWETMTISNHLFCRLELLAAHEISAGRGALSSCQAMTDATERALGELTQALMSRNAEGILRGARALAGLGQGLTPAGDDILAGAMLAIWAGHYPSCRSVTREIYSAAAARTNRLSRAFLESASEGLTSERWHALLRCLSGDPRVDLERATRQVAGFGATSGLDMLHGFVAAYRATRRRP